MTNPNRIDILCRRGRAGTGFIFACYLVGLAEPCVLAQKPLPPIVSTQREVVYPAKLFCTDLEILSKRLGIAFVAEGEVIPAARSGPLPSLSASLSPEDAVQEVADYFDYSALRQGNVYLLTKRYSNVEDLPDITPEECQSGLKSISKIVAAFNPKIAQGTDAGDPIARIGSLLSAEQLDKLGKSGLPVSELTGSQLTEVWKLAHKFYLQSAANGIEENSNMLENRNPADPIFHWQSVKNIYAFGYDTRSVELNDTVFIPVSETNRIKVLPNGTIITHTYTDSQTGGGLVTQDPTHPHFLSESIKIYLDDKNKSLFVVSIAAAIHSLNARVAKQVECKVDAMYAAKHVTVVGGDKLSAEALMHALAGVYGLRIAHNEDGSFVLTSPIAITAVRLSDLSRALRSAIPVPLYLMFHIRTRDKPVSPGVYEEQSAAKYNSSMRMFRYLAERAVKSQHGGRLALSHLDETARNEFAFASTVGSFSQACWLVDRPMPPYLSDMDHIILTGGITRNAEGAERFSLHFSYLDLKTGIMSRGVGFSNTIIP